MAAAAASTIWRVNSVAEGSCGSPRRRVAAVSAAARPPWLARKRWGRRWRREVAVKPKASILRCYALALQLVDAKVVFLGAHRGRGCAYGTSTMSLRLQ